MVEVVAVTHRKVVINAAVARYSFYDRAILALRVLLPSLLPLRCSSLLQSAADHFTGIPLTSPIVGRARALVRTHTHVQKQ